MPVISLQAQYLTFAQDETLYSLKCQEREVYVAADWETQAFYADLPVWIYSDNHHKTLRFLTPGLTLLLNSSRPKNCTQALTIQRGYYATSREWIVLTLNLQMILAKVDSKEWDPETVSRVGAYQTEALLKWSEYNHGQFRHQMAEQHLGQYSLSVIGGYQLQAGLTAQEFGAFLKMLEAAGQGTQTLWL